MSIVLRAVLLLGALLVLYFVIRKLRKAQIEVLAFLRLQFRCAGCFPTSCLLAVFTFGI